MSKTFGFRIVLVVMITAGLAITPADAVEFDQRTGWLTLVWGDSAPDAEIATHQILFLREDNGRTVELSVSAELLRIHGGALAWNGRRVTVTTVAVPASMTAPARQPLQVAAVHFLPTEEPNADLGGGVTGSQPWVSILCKFQDVPTEPENLSFFQNMYANVPGGLDHYWREVSYDSIDVVGSTAIDWVVLPNNQTFYVPTPGSNTTANLNALFADCTAAADPFVDFANGGSPFVGINMMFNALLDCCAWGGGMFGTLDGISKVWRTTWEPPWGYADEGVIAHEMGHGFGLPHANNWDGDGNPYDTPWDVMSAATSNAVNDATYGRLGKHVLAYHKNDILGWIAPGQIFEVTSPGSFDVTLDHMALASTANHRVARISIDGSSRFYTVEARKRVGNYDGAVPGDAIIICEVDPGRSEPAWTVDADMPPANFANNEGTMWKVGETFADPDAGIEITVLSETTDGFDVRITIVDTDEIFIDGFESGDTTAWSSVGP